MVLVSPAQRGSYKPPLHFLYTCPFDGSGTIFLLVQTILLLSALRTGGITHWKLTEDTISPESHAPEVDLKVESRSNAKSEDVLTAGHLSSMDPELALLVRYSSKSPKRRKLPPNRGGSGRGAFRRLSEEKDLDYCDSDKTGEDLEEEVVLDLPGKRRNSIEGKHCESSLERAAEPEVIDRTGAVAHSTETDDFQTSPLTCGEPVVSMPYDFLKGISRRSEHKPYPEPEVAMIFKKSELDTAVDLFAIERGLRKAFKENPQSITILNQIGNFWRIKGDTQKAIECFRKALHLSSDHPDLLLNLARVLFNLKFYDDSIFLAKKSLHVKSSDNHAWLQFFTLGEVYKALEQYDEAVFYFKMSLEKNPDLRVAHMHLRELGMDRKQTTNTYTLLIIVALIFIVLVLIYFIISTMNV